MWKIPHEILMWKFNLKYSHLYVKILIKFKCRLDKKINIENPIVWKMPYKILMWKINLK